MAGLDATTLFRIDPVSLVARGLFKLAGPSQMSGPNYGPYPAPGSYLPAITGNETADMLTQQQWSNVLQENPDLLAAYTGGGGIDLGGGFILTNRGLFDPGKNQVVSTPPLVPVETPANTGGGGGSSGGSSGQEGDIGSLEPDPDIMGGTLPETGTMPAPGPDGKPDPTKPPIPETTTKTTEEWVPIIQDWLIRFPNASDAEKQEAIQKYGVPAEAIEKAQEGIGTGGQGSGTANGPDGSGGSTGASGAGTGTGSGNGSGSGSGTGSGTGGLLGFNATRTTEMVFPEMYQPKLDRFTVLGNLLSTQPWRYRA